MICLNIKNHRFVGLSLKVAKHNAARAHLPFSLDLLRVNPQTAVLPLP